MKSKLSNLFLSHGKSLLKSDVSLNIYKMTLSLVSLWDILKKKLGLSSTVRVPRYRFIMQNYPIKIWADEVSGQSHTVIWVYEATQFDGNIQQ